MTSSAMSVPPWGKANDTTKSVYSNLLESPWSKTLRTMRGWTFVFGGDMASWVFISQLQFFYIGSHFLLVWVKAFFPLYSLLSSPLCLFFLPSPIPSPSLPAFLLSFYDHLPSFFPWRYLQNSGGSGALLLFFFPVGDWGNQHLFTIITFHVCTHLWQG